jgi:hypothetical protein
MIELHIPQRGLDTTVEVELEGVSYLYRLHWNEFHDRWHMDWFDIESNPLVTGVRVTEGTPFRRYNILPGLLLITSTDDTEYATLATINSKFSIFYLTSDEYDSIGPEFRTTFEVTNFLAEKTVGLAYLNGNLMSYLDGDNMETM